MYQYYSGWFGWYPDACGTWRKDTGQLVNIWQFLTSAVPPEYRRQYPP